MRLGKQAVFGGLAIALAFAAAAPASARSGTVSAAIEPEGYARIVFDFDRLPAATARLSTGVLVVDFAEPVELSTAELARGLGALVGVIRRDPDGTAIRMSLNKPVKLVSTVAGEKLFVDLLPAGWAGLPPPLPTGVIADLTRAAREARELKAGEARLRARPQARLRVDGATHPTFRRLVFGLGGDAAVDWRRDGPRVAVTVSGLYAFDAAAARARLPLDFAGLDAVRKGDQLVILAPAPGAGAVRGFREDGDFILDIDREASAKPDHAEAAPSPPAPAEPASHPEAAAAKPAAGHDPAPQPAAHVAAPQPASGPPTLLASRLDATKPVLASVMPASPSAAPVPAAVPGPVSIRRAGDTLRLVFPFARPTPAAVFLRGETLWAVFDDAQGLTLDALVKESGGAITAVAEIALDRGRAARLTLAGPRLVSAAVEGSDWIVSLGEDVLKSSGAVEFTAGFDAQGRATVSADAPGLGAIRTLTDPHVGDRLVVATLAPPARGVPSPRQYVEFAALPSAQGLALALTADDLTVAASLDRLTIARDGGLTVSTAETPKAIESEASPVMSAAVWAEEASKPFSERENELSLGAAMAEVDGRQQARFALARFYVALERAADARAVLETIVADGGLEGRDDRLAILRAAAEVELDHPRAALAILAAPALRLKAEAALWRAAAEAALGRGGAARQSLKEGEGALAGLAPAVRARFVALSAELALQAGDAAGAAQQFATLEVLPAVEGPAARELMRARIAEASGQTERAAAKYAVIARGADPAAAAGAELDAVSLGLKTKALPPEEAIVRLEKLVTGWRGDKVEAEALARLIGLYGDAERWRDAFSTLRVAVQAFPDAEDTRALQDRMQDRFTELFLGSGVDRMPKLDALALFYDFKDMSPGGKRGDELVRRLADKLVEVDLLDQAAELLVYQIDNRLTGAARAQVAARAALVELMNAKPGKALEVLRKTRQADLPGSLMKTRMRLEARALAETGRVDLALEMAAGLAGEEARRLKADILWSARRWPEAGEALEAALGSSWRGPEPLEANQRADAMRAAIASALAGDGLAVDRIRQKFSAKMADSPEAAGFEVVTAPVEARGEAFREIARSVAATSSFDAFLREYRGGASDPVAQSAENSADRKA